MLPWADLPSQLLAALIYEGCCELYSKLSSTVWCYCEDSLKASAKRIWEKSVILRRRWQQRLLVSLVIGSCNLRAAGNATYYVEY